MSLTLSLFVVLVRSSSLGILSDALAPVYTVNLDLLPEQRWARVMMADYRLLLSKNSSRECSDLFRKYSRRTELSANVIGDKIGEVHS